MNLGNQSDFYDLRELGNLDLSLQTMHT